MKKTKYDVKMFAFIGVMSAVVFVTTKFLSIPIPIGGGKTAIQAGNSMCVLAGLMFGGIPGGLAAGIGSMIVDLTDPAWAPEFWITFINKFCMGFVAGVISHMGKPSKVKNIVARVSGAVAYVCCYLTKTYITQAILLKNPWETTKVVLFTKGATSLTNALIAVLVSVILFEMLQPALKKAKILE